MASGGVGGGGFGLMRSLRGAAAIWCGPLCGFRAKLRCTVVRGVARGRGREGARWAAADRVNRLRPIQSLPYISTHASNISHAAGS